MLKFGSFYRGVRFTEAEAEKGWVSQYWMSKKEGVGVGKGHKEVVKQSE